MEHMEGGDEAEGGRDCEDDGAEAKAVSAADCREHLADCRLPPTPEVMGASRRKDARILRIAADCGG